VPASGVVGEDAPHDGGFGFEDHQSGRAGRVARQSLVAVRSLPGDDLAGPGAKQLAAPVPFSDLRAFVFGDDALDLGEQPGLRVVIDGWGVGEPHRHAVAGEFVEHDDLVGVDAGEPVGRQAPHEVDQPGLGGVAQGVQAGPIQPGAGVPIVAELGDQLVGFVAEALA